MKRYLIPLILLLTGCSLVKDDQTAINRQDIGIALLSDAEIELYDLDYEHFNHQLIFDPSAQPNCDQSTSDLLRLFAVIDDSLIPSQCAVTHSPFIVENYQENDVMVLKFTQFKATKGTNYYLNPYILSMDDKHRLYVRREGYLALNSDGSYMFHYFNVNSQNREYDYKIDLRYELHGDIVYNVIEERDQQFNLIKRVEIDPITITTYQASKDTAYIYLTNETNTQLIVTTVNEEYLIIPIFIHNAFDGYFNKVKILK